MNATRRIFTILVTLAIGSSMLGALSPVVLFFVCQAPGADPSDAMTVYRALLSICGGPP